MNARRAPIERISTLGAPAPGGHYSQAIRHGGLIYVSGQLPLRPDGTLEVDAGFEEQARTALDNLVAVLRAANSDPQRLLKVTAYIVGIENWSRFDAIYAAALGEARPARSVVPVKELHYGCLIEIDAIAASMEHVDSHDGLLGKHGGIAGIRPISMSAMSDADADRATGLSTEMGWPYRSEDWRFALGLGRGIAAECEGRLVASALWWPYGDAFATCGMIIVSSSMQRRGVGRALMANLLRDIGERTILLNSTCEGLRLYRAFGFESIGTVHQHQAPTSTSTAASMGEVGDVRPAAPGDQQAIFELDRCASDAVRGPLLAELSKIGTAAVIERNGNVRGFAMCRRFGLGYAIGPVVAENIEDAKALILYCVRRKAGEFLRIDTPGGSGLSAWLAGLGLPEVGSVTTMVRGRRPEPSAHARVFALASQSLG